MLNISPPTVKFEQLDKQRACYPLKRRSDMKTVSGENGAEVPAKTDELYSRWERIVPENFSLLSVTMKIKGEFLRIEGSGECHYLWFIRENGDVARFKINGSAISQRARLARGRIQQLRKELSAATSRKKIESLKKQVEAEQIQFIWPQILVAYFRGEDLGYFFTVQRTTKNAEKELSPKYAPKHRIIKDEVDKLLQSLRMERPETTLEESKQVYANLTRDSYPNVNRLYHYKGKK